MFKDQDLQTKLYQKGGFDLLQRTDTKINQQAFISTSPIIINVLTIIYIVIAALIKSTLKQKVIEKDVVKENVSSLDIIYITYMWITGFIIFGLLIALLSLTAFFTLPLAFIVIIDYAPSYYWILSMYLLPLIYIGGKKLIQLNRI